MDEKKKDGIYFIPVATKDELLHKITDPVSCEEVARELSKSVVDAFVSFFVAGPNEAKPEGARIMELIDKQEALKLMKLNYDDSPRDTGDLMYNDGVRSCVKTVREMKPVKGEWISKNKIFGGIPFACSNCGEETKDTVMGKPRFRFCPMCGAFCGGDE